MRSISAGLLALSLIALCSQSAAFEELDFADITIVNETDTSFPNKFDEIDPLEEIEVDELYASNYTNTSNDEREASDEQNVRLGENAILMGTTNTAAGKLATVSGGTENDAEGAFSSVAGGKMNRAKGNTATVSGGAKNEAIGAKAYVGGGLRNIADGKESTVAGGNENFALGLQASISGGSKNDVTPKSKGGTISGGVTNIVNGKFGAIGGGKTNFVSEDFGSVSGGEMNAALEKFATVSGGSDNVALGKATTIAGGVGNFAEAPQSSIAGGVKNVAAGQFSFIGGGETNFVEKKGSTIGGGKDNGISAEFATISGGKNNVVLGKFGVVIGGESNEASGEYSIAGGANAVAKDSRSAVFNLSREKLESSGEGEFKIAAKSFTLKIADREEVIFDRSNIDRLREFLDGSRSAPRTDNTAAENEIHVRRRSLRTSSSSGEQNYKKTIEDLQRQVNELRVLVESLVPPSN
mmetsp:Transcript_5346/g.15523  ORF Transcript_5346/g.15523 Transcript_5346/m.15523 type:complete len:468 (-) Transcript_5346:347-1750(-)